jgi:hypothetical protein
MALDLHLIRTNDFIRADEHRRPNPQASKEELARIAKACKERGIDRVLLDMRDVHVGPVPVFTPTELATLVGTFREMGFTHQQRLAVLYTADPHHGARLFAFICRERGWNVKAFDNFEDALNWLALHEEKLEEAGPSGS